MWTFNQLRQTRRLLGVWMLGALLVLLPLRGWAEVTMHLAGPVDAMALQAHGSPADADAAQAEAKFGTPPCHAAMDGSATAGAADAGDGCSLCSLCHASALRANEACLAPGATGSAAPSAARTGHGPPELPLPERPPRA